VKYKNCSLYLFAYLFLLSISQIHSQEKLAQAGFAFLSVNSDARASGMAEAMTSVPGYSGALFFNPAGMAEIPKNLSATFSLNSWIADIKHTTFSLAYKPAKGQYGVVGISLQSVDYGDVQGTMVWNNYDGYIDTETLNPSALSLGIGYAKTLSSKFAVGGQIKINYQNLGKNTIPIEDDLETKRNVTDEISYDFGTLYKTGFKSITFGMFVRNYSTEAKFEEEEFQLPLIFSIGISANAFDWIEISGPKQELLVAFDFTHPRAHPEQIKIGLEYKVMEAFSLRGGYISGNSQDDFSFGVGFSGLGLSKYFGLEIDYSYTPFEYFENVQRFTIRYLL
jgi:hypothetical protein